MDKERLNDFRRRLRNGETVRVVKGQVTLASEAPSKDPNGKPAATGGYKVKPHEWGRSLET